MLFPSIPFLFYFLPLFFIIYCAMPGITAKNFFLLLASLAFYAWGEPRFVILLLAQIALNYGAALIIEAREGSRRKLATSVATGLNPGIEKAWALTRLSSPTSGITTAGSTTRTASISSGY